ncbi:50S ribosomal protein L19 [Candidatus Nomurabacteria bacterium RIFCSPLOWO2_01_FULL_42_20]|uniref:50S ribosomal protein L19 n=1 Tax=Candidatus Nomurabacteria bacterium RIFCSPHIGHO2_01_FULL_42_16 TaxID=1801743 RepID=A0A1F6VHQ3_9BACT|nr:MAG: 50S ribosomal protein L19 [Candidatus Nomurabacteria bacterium RIFCSPHIGHO2_01_FULL_42_16]OGI92288.1 MAG: 50S ribosomal protein L19 [Candidatus Nomurabacteria bacterium RIFCSPLOWO2_01_FULL_42_20]
MAIKLTPVKTDERASLDFRSGDTVRVWSKVIEKDGKTRLQAFEGLTLARKHGRQSTNATFTLRKTALGVGVERIFPLHSPSIDRIEVIRRGSARRAKLYYIRDKAAKEIRKKMKSVTVPSASKTVRVEASQTES